MEENVNITGNLGKRTLVLKLQKFKNSIFLRSQSFTYCRWTIVMGRFQFYDIGRPTFHSLVDTCVSRQFCPFKVKITITIFNNYTLWKQPKTSEIIMRLGIYILILQNQAKKLWQGHYCTFSESYRLFWQHDLVG